ncbi:phosphoinositide phosphatase SAC1-like [Pistacia vera]|uniref:phosphoinositide phosphatase SAC1-like n=1 Tax=Pistacia vera TaxID=55513 RepID=UPI001262FC67|nr:phosphoinositide phosphatase SAC1-like [Pistacia vera]
MGWEGQNFLKEAVFSKSWEKQLSTLEVLIEDASLRELRASSGDLARLASSGENLSSIINRERDTDFGQQNKKDNHDDVAPCFQSGVLRTNCINCLDPTNVAQYAYGLAALGRQLHAMGLTDMPKVDPNSSIAAALMDMYQSMGDALAQQYGGSAAHNSVFPERQGRWKATTQSREFLKSIKRYYNNAYTDGEKQDAINLFLGYFKPQEGKPALWELDSDYYLHFSGIGDDVFPDKCLEATVKAVGHGRILAPVPACREDFSRLKLTSFEKLIAKTCISMKNVKTLHEIQLKSPNWLFGQRKFEGNVSAPKVTSHEIVNREVHNEIRADSFCDLNWLSSVDDINEEDVFQRYLTMASADEANGWYGGTLLGDEDEGSEIYTELCQREMDYSHVLEMNRLDVVDKVVVEAEMEAVLREYDQIGADLWIIPASCKLFTEDSSRLSRCGSLGRRSGGNCETSLQLCFVALLASEK